MKYEENIANDYLHTKSHDVVFEPDGNIPPDFKVNQTIGVEVRRLNHIVYKGAKPQGIEQERIKLLRALEKVLREFDVSIPTTNYFIGLSYFRPLGNILNIQKITRQTLLKFLRDQPATPFEVKLSRSVSMTIAKATRMSTKIFNVGIESDMDSGGFVAPLYIENINFCLMEKTSKIQPYKSKYAEWWLLLVDFLVGGIGEPEKTIIIENVDETAEWKKIIVIHPITKKEILLIE